MTVIHRHHILPRHAGGTDDLSNIALLTVEEHAEAHRLLFEQYGRVYDRIAWLSLTKQIDCAEAQRLASIERNTGVPKTPEHRRKLSVARKGKKLPAWVGKKSGAARRGRKASADHREAISAGNRGKKIPSASVQRQALSRQQTDGTLFEYEGKLYGSFSEAATDLMAVWGISKEAARARVRRFAGYVPPCRRPQSEAPAQFVGRAA